MATSRFTFTSQDCNFTPSACVTLARLAVDIIGNDDFLSDAAQNSFVLDLVSAVGPSIAFDAIARQLWRINQYTPYGSGAYTYAYPPSLSGCPSSFLITHDVTSSSSLTLSHEQQRVLAAFINARVSVADMLVVCPYHVLMSFCKWLNAGNSNKVMSLDGSLQYNTSNAVSGVYANTYDAQDYLGNAIYYYQLTSLVQTSSGYIFDANYSASSIMTGLTLDTNYASANTDALKYGLVATIILAVNPQNPLRAGYGNISNAYGISTTDGLTMTRSANRNATILNTSVLGGYVTYILNNSPSTTYHNGMSVIPGKQLNSDNKQLITATGLSAQGYFDAYLLTGVASDIPILKAAGYNVSDISGIKSGTVAVAAFQIVSNYKTATFTYSEIIVGLALTTPQQYYEKVVNPLNLSDLSAITFLKDIPFSLDASAIYGITNVGLTTKKFNDARIYITSGFNYSTVNSVFGVDSATKFYDTYRLSEISGVVNKIIAFKTNSNYSMAAIRAVPALINSTPRDFKEAGYTFKEVKTEFESQLSTASAFYTAFNGSPAFNAGATPFYSVPQQIFIFKKMQYDSSAVYSIVVNNNKVYSDPLTYTYTVLAGDTVLKTNVPSLTGEESYSQTEINTTFSLNSAQGILDTFNLPNERLSIYIIKARLPTVPISELKAVTRGGATLSAFQNPQNYLGGDVVPGVATRVAGYTFDAIKTGFQLTTAAAFYGAFNGSAYFNDLSNNVPFYSVPQQIFILKRMTYDISGVYSIMSGANKVYSDSQLYSYTVVAGDVNLIANVSTVSPVAVGDTSYSASDINTFFDLTTPQKIVDVLNLPNLRSSIYIIKNRLPTITIAQIREVRRDEAPLSAFDVPSNYSGSEILSGVTVNGFTNTQITEGFFGDFNRLVGVTSANSLPSFTYVDATYSSNGNNLLTKLKDLSQVKDASNNYVYTAWRNLLINSINQTKTTAVNDLSGNDIKNSVYRVVYLSSVMNSDSSGTPFSPNTEKGLYAFFDLPAFILSYTPTGTKPYDFLNHSEYLTYSSNTSMIASSETAKRIVKSSTDLVTGQAYTAYPSGISFTLYDGNNTTTVRYSLGKIAANTWHLNSSSAAVNNNNVRYFDSGYSIPTAITLINSTNKVSVIATSAWPIATSFLVPLADTATYIQSSFYDATKSMEDNITAAKSLPFSADAWNFTNLINGPINNANTLLNLDGVSWKQLVGAGANTNAMTADLAANVNFIATSVSEPQLVSMFNIPLANALTVANKRNDTTDLIGRGTANSKWTLSGVASSSNYSKTQRKQLFKDSNGLVSASLAAQILESDAFIKLYWSPVELTPLKDKLELSDLLTATEEITSEWGTDYTASANSSYIRMIYHTTTERIALVKLYYPTLSDTDANSIAVLTNKSDIVDEISRRP